MKHATRLWLILAGSGIINNDEPKARKSMTVYLADNDGATWAHKCCVDTRNSVSYSDADFFGDKIYLIYDHERTGAKEILLTVFDENDVINGTAPRHG